MRVAVVGSRGLTISNLEDFLPENTSEIISGGARGIDTCAREYALSNGIPLREFLPDYERYGRRAPLVRNFAIVDHADYVLAFWDGKSRGTVHTLRYCIEKKLPHRIVKCL